jgi:PST family polysaccharide transporter
MYVGYITVVYLVSRRLIGFNWTAETTRLGLLSLPLFGAIFSTYRLLPLWPATLLGLSLTLFASVLCLRGLVARIGFEHRIVRAITRLPGGKLLLIAH